MDIVDQWKETVEGIAYSRLERDVLFPDNELIEDYIQDVWLELFTIKDINPKISNARLIMALQEGESLSKPDPHIIYT